MTPLSWTIDDQDTSLLILYQDTQQSHILSIPLFIFQSQDTYISQWQLLCTQGLDKTAPQGLFSSWFQRAGDS